MALSDADFRHANVKATETIDIANFTALADISPEFYDTPYYLSPAKKVVKRYTRCCTKHCGHRRNRRWRVS